MVSPFIDFSHITNSIYFGDAMQQAWILAWDNYVLISDPLSFFNSNIFYPHKNTLVYGDHQFSISILSLPINIITKNPIFSYNIVFIVTFFISAVGMFKLMFYYTKNFYSSFISGVIYAFSTYTMLHAHAHLNVISIQWIPLTVLFFHKFLEKKSYKNLFTFTLFFLLESLTGWYNAFFISIILLSLFVFSSISYKLYFDMKFLKGIMLFFVISLITLFPFFLPYYRLYKYEGKWWSLDEVRSYSLNLGNYFRPSFHTLLGQTLHKLNLIDYHGYTHKYGEKITFLGFVPLFIGSIGTISIYKTKYKNSKIGQKKNEVTLFYLILFLIGLILSFGPNLPPYYIIYKLFPLIRGIRAVARFSLLSFFSLSVLSGFGVAFLTDFFNDNKSKVLISLIICELIFIETFVIGFHKPGKINFPRIYDFINENQEIDGIVELPTKVSSNKEFSTIYMLFSTRHWKPIVNGYSTFYPPSYDYYMKKIENFPSNESLIILKSLNVSHVIVHSEYYGEYWNTLQQNLWTSKRFFLIKEVDGDFLFEIMS